MKRLIGLGVVALGLAACSPDAGTGDSGRRDAAVDTSRADVPTDRFVRDTFVPDVPTTEDVPVVPPTDVPITPDVPTVDVPILPDVTPMDVPILPDAPPADVPLPDVGPDVPRGTSPLFGLCNADLDCAAGGCLRDYPGGLCSIGCATNTQCGTAGFCSITPPATTGICIPSCTIGGRQCNVTTECFDLSPTGTGPGACFPSCAIPAPTGGAMCGTGLTCDSYTTTCQAAASTGADNGAACTTDTACRGGQCIRQLDTAGNPTGFVGGYCVSFARGVDLTAYGAGRPLPQSNCPTGSVAIPFQSAGAVSSGAGDAFVCLKRCTTTTGCRAGYTCNHDLGGGALASDGWCNPYDDCTMAGMTCPSGTSCRTFVDGSGTTQHLCG